MKKVCTEMYRGMNFLKYQMQLLLTTVLILEIHDMNSKIKFYVIISYPYSSNKKKETIILCNLIVSVFWLT